MPGFRTELTGLTEDETVALLAAGAGRADQVPGLGAALGSALRKVIDALPAGRVSTAEEAAQRVLVDPRTDLLARPLALPEPVPPGVMSAIRRAVLGGLRLRIDYAAAGQGPRPRVVDPIGLVGVRGVAYLLATRSGADRTYRLSRMTAAEVVPEPAQRPDRVDLQLLWQERSARFRAGGDLVTVVVLLDAARRDELLRTVVGVASERVEDDGRLRFEVTFQDLRHAVWAMWQFAADAEVLTPESLRARLHDRARAVEALYAGPV